MLNQTSLVRAFAAILLCASVSMPVPAAAQQTGGIYVIDQDRLYQQSEFGRRVRKEISDRAAMLTEENTRLENELKAEELALTEERPNYSASEFRKLADDFNTKVERIRSEQAQKSQEMNNWADAERVRFLEALLPVLTTYATELDAIAVFDHRNAILVSDRIDITAAMIERINLTLGNGMQAASE